MKVSPKWLLCIYLAFGFITTLGSAVQAKDVAIVSMTGSGEVAFIDIERGKVMKSVKLLGGASFPEGIAITPDQSTVIVVSINGYISFLDVKKRSVIKTLALLSGPEQHGITLQPNEFNNVAITPNGSAAVVTEGNELGQLFFLNLETLEPIDQTLFIGDELSTVTITSDGLTVYVLDDGSMHVVSLAGAITIVTFPLPDEITDFALTPDETRAIGMDSDNHIYLMETNAWTTIDQIIVDESRFTEPRQVEVSPDGSLAIVTNGTDPSITFVSIQGASLAVLEVLEIGGTASGVAFTNDGQTAVVTLLEASMIKIIDVPTRQVRATVSANKLGLAPTGVVIAHVDP